VPLGWGPVQHAEETTPRRVSERLVARRRGRVLGGEGDLHEYARKVFAFGPGVGAGAAPIDMPSSTLFLTAAVRNLFVRQLLGFAEVKGLDANGNETAAVRLRLREVWGPKWNESVKFFLKQSKAAVEAFNTTKNDVVYWLLQAFRLKAGGALGSPRWIDAIARLEAAGSQPVTGPGATSGLTASPESTEKHCMLVHGVYLVTIRESLEVLEAIVAHDYRRAPSVAGEQGFRRMAEMQVAIKEAIANYKRHGVGKGALVPLLRIGETHKLIAFLNLYYEAKAELERVQAAEAAAAQALGVQLPQLQPQPREAAAAAAVAAAAAELAARTATVLARARNHGHLSSGCPMVSGLLTEPLLSANAIFTITYLSLLPSQYTALDSAGVSSASDACSTLAHFVELLATRAIGTEGFATGGFMRSPPGLTLSWASHGTTVASVMAAAAKAGGLTGVSVTELVKRLG
jgi:hypothetical protein